MVSRGQDPWKSDGRTGCGRYAACMSTFFGLLGLALSAAIEIGLLWLGWRSLSRIPRTSGRTVTGIVAIGIAILLLPALKIVAAISFLLLVSGQFS
jgi:hypothetical protein